MAAYTKVGVGYNIQIAVDAKNKMIVEQAVTNQVVDMGLLNETAESARAILDVENIDVVADRGYFKIEDIEACEKAGLTPYVPKPQRGSSVRNGFFRKDEFRYDPDQDVYICPAGETLSPNHEGKSRDLKKIDYSNPAACPACPLRSRCTTNLRRVSRLENEAVLDRMAARLKARPEILDRRREIVEHPFGSIKQWMNQGAFLMKGLDNVRAEFSLTALVYNLRRALNILGVEAMMAAVRRGTRVIQGAFPAGSPAWTPLGSRQAILSTRTRKMRHGASHDRYCATANCFHTVCLKNATISLRRNFFRKTTFSAAFTP